MSNKEYRKYNQNLNDAIQIFGLFGETKRQQLTPLPFENSHYFLPIIKNGYVQLKVPAHKCFHSGIFGKP